MEAQTCSARISDLLLSHSRRSRTRRVLVICSVALVLLLLLFSVQRGLSSSAYVEDYHPSRGRYLERGGKEALFNKIRAHDDFNNIPRHLDIEISDGRRERDGEKESIFGDAPGARPCNCSTHGQQRLRRTSLYPLWSFKDDVRGPSSFTMIILAYNRSDLLLRLLNHYSAMPHLETIVVVWNSRETTTPREEWKRLGPHPVDVKFKVQPENRLRNRLQIFDEIKSSALFLVDDDLLISARDIQFAFRVWKEFPHLIVGFYPRKHVLSPVTGLYSYGSDELDSLTELGSFSYSMVLTGAAFLHKRYVEMFNDHHVVPPAVHDLIDSTNNCEDIALNVMVGGYLLRETGRQQCSGLFVKPVQLQNLERETNSAYKGLWKDPAHLAERSYCLNRLATFYKGQSLPLFHSDLTMVPMQTAMTKCGRAC